MQKEVLAVQPCKQDKGSNFKQNPYKAWINIGGNVSKPNYPPRKFQFLGHKFNFPTLLLSKISRLRFVEACTINFDCFPEYLYCETIPIIWDCWPHLWDKTELWLKKHKVKCAIFTSSQVSLEMKRRLPNINIYTVTEGIDTIQYHEGNLLVNRDIDLLEYGRVERNLFSHYIEGINHINVKNSNDRMSSFEMLLKTISESKITVAIPRCDSDKKYTGGIETLTQRFWECMLSRTVLLGRAPKELTDLIGYNPVIDIDYENYEEQIKNIVAHIEEYQPLVDKNRETALRMSPWEIRMKQIMDWLISLGYKI